MVAVQEEDGYTKIVTVEIDRFVPLRCQTSIALVLYSVIDASPNLTVMYVGFQTHKALSPQFYF
jgi:hypothetical protein